MNSNYNNQDRTQIPSLFENNKVSQYFFIERIQIYKVNSCTRRNAFSLFFLKKF